MITIQTTYKAIENFLAWAKRETPQFVAAYHVPTVNFGEYMIGECENGDLCLFEINPEMPGYQACGWTDSTGSYAGMDLPALIKVALTGKAVGR
jgi:hypothetical protein